MHNLPCHFPIYHQSVNCRSLLDWDSILTILFSSLVSFNLSWALSYLCCVSSTCKAWISCLFWLHYVRASWHVWQQCSMNFIISSLVSSKLVLSNWFTQGINFYCQSFQSIHFFLMIFKQNIRIWVFPARHFVWNLVYVIHMYSSSTAPLSMQKWLNLRSLLLPESTCDDLRLPYMHISWYSMASHMLSI